MNSTENHSHRTALHKASFFGHGHVVEYLCSLDGLVINAMDADGDTALHDAARFGHVQIVETLLHAGADKNIVNNDGKKAIYLAIANGKMETVKALM